MRFSSFIKSFPVLEYLAIIDENHFRDPLFSLFIFETNPLRKTFSSYQLIG
jgi:hypothetical protein